MSFQSFLRLSYWFAIATPPFRPASFIIALSALSVLFALAVALSIMARAKRSNPPLARYLRRLTRPLLFLSLMGSILVWFRQLGAVVLSARLWLALVVGVAVAWLILILKNFLKTYKGDIARINEERKYRAYLPKKK